MAYLRSGKIAEAIEAGMKAVEINQRHAGPYQSVMYYSKPATAPKPRPRKARRRLSCGKWWV